MRASDRDRQPPPAPAARVPVSPERQRCEAKDCRLPAHNAVLYRGLTKHLCNTHAKVYAGWGPRDRFQMAQALWSWPPIGQVALIIGPRAIDACDEPLPARGRTASVHTARAFDQGARKSRMSE